MFSADLASRATEFDDRRSHQVWVPRARIAGRQRAPRFDFRRRIHAETMFFGVTRASGEAVESGASRREAAEWFDVSPSSAIKWMQRRQETGSIAPKPSGG